MWQRAAVVLVLVGLRVARADAALVKASEWQQQQQQQTPPTAEGEGGSCAAAAPATAPPDMSDMGLEPMSWVAPRVFWYPRFMSPEECAYMIEFGMKHKNFDADKDLSVAYFGWKDHEKDPVLAAVESRIAIVTGIPPHPHEEPVNVHHNRRRVLLPGDNIHHVDNIHHDKVQKEHSAATVIVYLNNVTRGGGTIWPCAASLANGTSPRFACNDAFGAGARWFDGTATTMVTTPLCSLHLHLQLQTLRTWGGGSVAALRNARAGIWLRHPPREQKGKMKKVQSPTEVHGQLQQIRGVASMGCAAESFDQWKRPPVRSTAIAGAAAVFFHNHPNGAPDPFSWHGGCTPLSDSKWTLQKFKEMPMPFRDRDKDSR